MRSERCPSRPSFCPHEISSLEVNEFERLSGPAKWNRQQGFYVYRVDRLIQSGGWCGLRAIDEHTKLARAAIDFMPELDELFRINVAKMRVSLPPEIKPLIEPHATDLCHRAQEMYRRDLREGQSSATRVATRNGQSSLEAQEIGAAIASAALATKTAVQVPVRGRTSSKEQPRRRQTAWLVTSRTPWYVVAFGELAFLEERTVPTVRRSPSITD